MPLVIRSDQNHARRKALSDLGCQRASLETFTPAKSWFQSVRRSFRAKMGNAGVSAQDLLENQERVKRERVKGNWG
jgi:hypothetical protein